MAKRRGAGTTFELGSTNDPATSTWTAIPQLTNIRINERSGEIEVTDLASTRKEYIQELADSATISCTLQWDPNLATHNQATGLQSLFASGATRAVRLTSNGSPTRERHVVFVMSMSRTFEPSAVMTAEVELRATGAPTFEAV